MHNKTTAAPAQDAFDAAYAEWQVKNDSKITREFACIDMATTVETPCFVMPAGAR